MTFTWEGRSLKKVMKDSATLATYTYNADGVRVKKVSGGVTTTYYVQDGVCYGESRSDGKSLQYLRDENGQVIGVRYQNGNIWDTTYYFVFNGQGDVIQVVSAEDGQVMANYTYDAWGKLLSVTNAAGGAVSADAESIAAVNPFRYRGYYYDTETGLYYLQSRYYDADVGRFVNADALVDQSSVLGYNLFAYCHNNPVNRYDPTGHCSGYPSVVAPNGVNSASSQFAECILRHEHMQMASVLPAAQWEEIQEDIKDAVIEETVQSAISAGADLAVKAGATHYLNTHSVPRYTYGPLTISGTNKTYKTLNGMRKGKITPASTALTAAFYASDLHSDYVVYGANGDFWTAAGITTAQYVVCIGLEAAIAATGAPAIVVFAGGVIVGGIVSLGSQHVKNAVLGY